MNISQFIIIILSSGFVAAMVSAVMQKKNEKETRIFIAKLEAYKKFLFQIKGFYRRERKSAEGIYAAKLYEISAPVLLVSSKEINEKIHTFNNLLVKCFNKYKKGNKKEAEKILEKKLNPLRIDIEELMRKDLGFS